MQPSYDCIEVNWIIASDFTESKIAFDKDSFNKLYHGHMNAIFLGQIDVRSIRT
jgi:hypothetical protein